MKTGSIIVAAMLCILTLLPNLASAGKRGESKIRAESELLDKCGEAQVGEQAPWLSGWTLDDKVFNIQKPFKSSNKQRLALVFWATWCKPCRDGLVRLTDAADDLSEAGIEVVLVNVGEDRDKILTFFKDEESAFPIVLDPYQKSSKSYLLRPNGQVGLPVTALIGRNGVVQCLIGAEGDDYVRRILAGK